MSTAQAIDWAGLRGPYANRVGEYQFAALAAFRHGLLRHNSPILDIGCGNPYEGMYQFLLDFGWSGHYVGIDREISEDAREQRQYATGTRPYRTLLLSMDLDSRKALPFPPSPGKPAKEYAVAFAIEALEHLRDPEAIVHEMQRVAATVFVIGPNAAFAGWRPADPTHISPLSERALRETWGFQVTGFVNFNGRPTAQSEHVYDRDNGDSALSSEVWAVWRDARAEWICRPREHRTLLYDDRSTDRDLLAMEAALGRFGHRMVREERRRG